MTREFNKPRKRQPSAKAASSDDLSAILEQLQKSNDQLQKSNDQFREIYEDERAHRIKLEKDLQQERDQWKQERDQWKQERDQWKQERDHFSDKIENLEEQLKDLGLQLKQQMGIAPSSEKASSLEAAGSGSDDDDPKSKPENETEASEQEIKFHLIKNRDRPKIDNPMKLNRQEWWEALDSDPALIPPSARIFLSQIFSKHQEEHDFSFTKQEREGLFGRTRGLHSKKDRTKVYDFEFSVKELSCQQETLSDVHSGTSYRKSKSLSPPGGQLSWAAIAKISVLVAEYAFPMERLAHALGGGYFSSANIYRWFNRSAGILQPVYIAAGEQLGRRCEHFKMDDTSCLVLQLREESKQGRLVADSHMTGSEWDDYLEGCSERFGKNGVMDLVSDVIDAFGRVSATKSKDVAKTSLNTTLISGKLDRCDYRSTIYFYRSHFGQAGNLLDRILSLRKSSDKRPIGIQCDMSPQNLTSKELEEVFDIHFSGCMSHARRPFFRYRAYDKELCFAMLRGFACLANIEERIRRGRLVKERILAFRQRHARKVWQILRKICLDVTESKSSRWKKGDKLYTACAYLINHYGALTYYLDHPEVDLDNNSSEQGLRGEKMIQNAAGFRNSENGRVALDIHRTMIACCNTANLPYETFLKYIGTFDSKNIKADPQSFFPHVVAKKLSEDPSHSLSVAAPEEVFSTTAIH